MNNLEDLRQEIDKIDNQLLELLARRIWVVKKIGVMKKKLGKEVKDPKREREILEKKASQAKSLGLSENFIKKIWKVFFEEAYKHQ